MAIALISSRFVQISDLRLPRREPHPDRRSDEPLDATLGYSSAPANALIFWARSSHYRTVASPRTRRDSPVSQRLSLRARTLGYRFSTPAPPQRTGHVVQLPNGEHERRLRRDL